MTWLHDAAGVALYLTGLAAIFGAADLLAFRTGRRWLSLAGACLVAACVTLGLLPRLPLHLFPLLNPGLLLVAALVIENADRRRVRERGAPADGEPPARQGAAITGRWAAAGASLVGAALLGLCLLLVPPGQTTSPAAPAAPAVVVEGGWSYRRYGGGVRTLEGVARNRTGHHFRAVVVTSRTAGGGRASTVLGSMRPYESRRFWIELPRSPDTAGPRSARVEHAYLERPSVEAYP